jgi:CRISPR-associated protein Cmr3
MTTLFIEPLDVLYLRGNKLFGDPGAHGEALMPPWPSLAAGAIRSRLMMEGETLESLAAFRLTQFALARRLPSSAGNQPSAVELLWPLPADVMVTDEQLNDTAYLHPAVLPPGIATSHPLPQLPAWLADKPGKPVSGLWLNGEGVAAWLAGKPLAASHMVRASALWQTDPRLGIALDADTRSAAEGKIYTTECVALRAEIGFAAAYTGAPKLPEKALLRLGGDGRGARVQGVSASLPEPDWQRIEREGRFRLLLTTPGIFADGWRPANVPAALVSATVHRPATISGWDLATGAPKDARRTAPVGSVYWFDQLAGLDALKALHHDGLALEDPVRRAEGFNQCCIAPWAFPNHP